MGKFFYLKFALFTALLFLGILWSSADTAWGIVKCLHLASGLFICAVFALWAAVATNPK